MMSVNMPGSKRNWDANANEAIARIVQNTRDADLCQIDDMIIRMRRARRSYQLGWATLGLPGLPLDRPKRACNGR